MASLEIRSARAMPAAGAYAAYAFLGERSYPAVANVGAGPSFESDHPIVDVHLLDMDQEFLDCDLELQFCAWLQDEMPFAEGTDMVAQLEQDSRKARQILAAAGKGPAPAVVPSPAGCSRYWEIEHTADRALGVWGSGLPNLFAAAAKGMYGMMADLDGLAATGWRDVLLEEGDRESLLVEWLNELLFITETEDWLPVDYRIQSITETALVASVGGVSGAPTKAKIKAATFHELAILPDQGGWSVAITFDV
jgi:SHS2 domain-containing protein